ncbi:hypothetical protein EJB05_27663 [Eragrostis curvula]|uniref:Uncharacterized protein n=1 Tax=Eragrostis curvula TaxID=38414 RepID=A0A5J9UP91_9POAL|nr:hypothetical protein EJB05_27663 [Eragrostis curvula]
MRRALRPARRQAGDSSEELTGAARHSISAQLVRRCVNSMDDDDDLFGIIKKFACNTEMRQNMNTSHGSNSLDLESEDFNGN